MKKVFKIQYIPTKNIFELSKNECDRLMLEEPNNFKVIDEDYTAPVEEPEQTSVEQESIVEQELIQE